MGQTNFLIGRGELLTHDIPPPRIKPTPSSVYTFDESLERLGPQIEALSVELDNLPSAACPGDYGVIKMALNPSYIAKSHYPKSLLKWAGLDALGSRTIRILPERWSRKAVPTEVTTTELLVAGKRSTFRSLYDHLAEITDRPQVAEDFSHIEKMATFMASERIVGIVQPQTHYFEVGLHLLDDPAEAVWQQQSFVKYAQNLGMEVFSKMNFKVGSLWFVPMKGDPDQLEIIAEFVFVRVIRPMPKLRGMRPVPRGGGITVPCTLPTDQPLSSEPKVAILDGGLPEKHVIKPWLGEYYVMDDEAEDDPEGPEHGLGVTSAFLFGPITPGAQAQRPYSYVDHIRVLDRESDEEDPLELYRTLGWVEQILLSRRYEFLNLSLGPDLEMNDHEVHAWTAVIDNILSDGDTVMTIAAGNNGEADHELGYDRIQVPSDCVNAIAVGAADNVSSWARAPYSAIGPGRSPGVIKPDLMAFGGDAHHKYFHVMTLGSKPELSPTMGTSFAAPYLLRNAVGIRAILGEELTPLAIKALLVHSADPLDHDKVEVGWGKIPEDLMSIITCPSGVARVVYQGELRSGKYLRAALPIPKGGLTGNIKLRATFCYASPIDPQDSAAYTCAGLEVRFRPKGKKIKKGKQNADTKSIFTRKDYAPEEVQRSDYGKWETVLHGELSLRGSTLEDPIFDIHYNKRDGGAVSNSPDKIRYALIITVEAHRHADLFNDILRNYQNILTPIQPKVSLPIRT